MDRSNEYLAKGLAKLVLKTIHMNTLAGDYTPADLAKFLRTTGNLTRSSDEV